VGEEEKLGEGHKHEWGKNERIELRSERGKGGGSLNPLREKVNGEGKKGDTAKVVAAFDEVAVEVSVDANGGVEPVDSLEAKEQLERDETLEVEIGEEGIICG